MHFEKLKDEFQNYVLVRSRYFLAGMFMLMAIFGFVNIYIMSAINGLYPAYLLITTVLLCTFLFSSGLGLLLRKTWAVYAFVCFVVASLSLTVVSQFGLLRQDWLTFSIFFFLLCVIFALTGRSVKNSLARSDHNHDKI
jgi:hypothetical protein